MSILRIFSLLIFVISNSCGGSALNQEEEIKTLYIDSTLEDCQGVALQQCMLIRENPNEEWTYFYDVIEGFQYKEGYHYVIKVKITPVENPMADASSLHYKLIEILSKEKVISELNLQIKEPEKIIYEASTRGFSKKIRITQDYIIKTENQNSDTISLSDTNWLTIKTLLAQSIPRSWDTLSPPSTGYRSDAGLHTTIFVQYPMENYTTPTFDEHNPPKKLSALITKIRTLSEDLD